MILFINHLFILPVIIKTSPKRIILCLCDSNVSEDIFILSERISIDGNIFIVPFDIGSKDSVLDRVCNHNILWRIKVQLTKSSFKLNN